MFLDFHTHNKTTNLKSIYNLEIQEIEKHNYFSKGIHPIDLAKFDFNFSILEEVFNSPNCLAIGEIGLDKIISVPFQKQIELFELQVSLSEKMKLPVILHCVKAWNEVREIRKKMKVFQYWIFHGFRKSSLLPSVLAEENMLIGIGTAILWDEPLQKTLLEIPLDRILLETDDDEKNTIELVYEKVSQLKNISLLSLEKQIETNFKNTFQKWEIGSKDLNF